MNGVECRSEFLFWWGVFIVDFSSKFLVDFRRERILIVIR